MIVLPTPYSSPPLLLEVFVLFVCAVWCVCCVFVCTLRWVLETAILNREEEFGFQEEIPKGRGVDPDIGTPDE